MIKAVIFDLDNTVYDYDFCNTKAMDRLCRYACRKYDITEDMFEWNYARAKENVKETQGNTGACHNRMLYMQRFLELIGCNPADGALELYDIYWDTMLETMTLFPYVMPLIQELKHRGIGIGVLTDLTAHIQHRKIKKLGLAGVVDYLVTSEEAGAEKPSPRAFSFIQKKTGLRAEEMLMIGDSVAKDIKGAEDAGMSALLFSADKAENMQEICMEYIDERAVEK